MGKDDVAVVSGPAFRADALAGVILPTLLSGRALVFLPAFEPWSLARAIASRRATLTTVVPAMLRMLLDSGALAANDVSCLRAVLCGSARVTRELLELAEQALPGAAIIEGYGPNRGWTCRHQEPAIRRESSGTIGLPLPGVEVRLVGDEAPPADRSVGELRVRGPGVMTGYYERPDDSADRLLPDGWLRTGDLASRDADGYYTLARIHRCLSAMSCG